MGIARWTMGSSSSSWDYYPHDSNGLAVQSALAEPCACPVYMPTQVAVCSPLGDGGVQESGVRRHQMFCLLCPHINFLECASPYGDTTAGPGTVVVVQSRRAHGR